MIAIAIGPQNTLRVSGIIASTVAAAVSMTGRVRCTAASSTAFHGSRPSAPSRLCTWSIRITELRMIMPHERDDAEDRDEAERRLEHEQRGDDADQSERRGEEHHEHAREALQLQHQDRQDRDAASPGTPPSAPCWPCRFPRRRRRRRCDSRTAASPRCPSACGWISLVTDTPCSPSLTSARTVIAMSRLRRHSTGSSSSYAHARDLRQRHDGALARVEVDVLQRVEVETLRRHRTRDDVDQVLVLAQLRQRRAVHHASGSRTPRRPARGRARAPCPGRDRP